MKTIRPIYIILILCFLLELNRIYAQDASQNYILTRVMLNEEGSKYVETIQYYDGLGRLSQTVQKNATASGNHLVSLQEYDALGRESNAWLPVVSNTDYLPYSDFKTKAADCYGGSERPYSFNEYESSPLNRVLKVYGPGAAWDNNPVTTDYLTNTASGMLGCKNYSVSESDALVDRGYYPAGELYIVKKADEDGRTTYVFTDKLGRQLLSRQISNGDYHDTYFVYDDFDNQRFVLPPAYQDEPDLSLYAYQYKFDGRKRCIEKKLPGCEPIYYVYDRADRMVYSQSGVQRGRQEWTFYLYDALNRLTVQGTCKNSNFSSIAGGIVTCSLARDANGISPVGLGISGYSSSNELLSPVVHLINYYDRYDFLSLPGFENRDSYPQGTVNATGLLTGTVTYQLAHQERKFCTALYYDQKGRVVRTTENNYRNGNETSLTEYSFSGNPLRVTHLHTAPLKTPLTEVSTFNYDSQNRITKVSHQLNDYPEMELCKNTYDDLGRLQSKRFHRNDALQSNYSYNIRNWLTDISGNQYKQEFHYNDMGNAQYNGNVSITAWSSINEGFSRRYMFLYDDLNRLTSAVYGEAGVRNKAFGVNYEYDKMGNMTALRRNGTLGSFRFGTIDDLVIEHRGNQLKRVTDWASYNDPLYEGAFNFVDGADEAVEYEYDGNGNMVKDLNKSISHIDYNMLNLPDKIALTDQRYIHYSYSADGSLRRKEHYYMNETTSTIPMPGVTMGGDDRVKQRPGIQVNPGVGIDLGDAVPAFYKGYVSTDYCSNIIYETGKLKMILTSEGYITMANNTPTYHYYLKDHLGNNRVVVNQDGAVEETNHYYPFGGLFGEGTDDARQPNKFGGKEFDRMHGLDWYNFEARLYDPSVPHIPTPDPLCEKYYSISPYVYCMNNPVNAIDPDGRKVVFINGYLGFGSPEGGKQYWSNSFVSGAKKFFEDNTEPYYTNVDHGLLSFASGRHKEGYKYAKEHYASLIKDMGEGETFKLVSHSMGGAFSSGMKEYLEEQGWTVESSVFINTYQSNCIKNEKNNSTYTIDFQNSNDPVLFWFDPNLGKGKIENSNINIRVESDEKTEYIHRSPIDSGGDFWKNLQKIIESILNK